jgi:hypothetical protein
MQLETALRLPALAMQLSNAVKIFVLCACVGLRVGASCLHHRPGPPGKL